MFSGLVRIHLYSGSGSGSWVSEIEKGNWKCLISLGMSGPMELLDGSLEACLVGSVGRQCETSIINPGTSNAQTTQEPLSETQ